MHIDCGTCQARGDACSDCVVSIVFGGPPALGEVDEIQRRALVVLADAGLVPRLQHAPPAPLARLAPTAQSERRATG